MTQYLVNVLHPAGYDASKEDDAMARDIDRLNDEMTAAGARVFAGGLHPPGAASLLRPGADGDVLITDGPFAETKEYVGGFWVLEAPDLDAALAWARKAAIACRTAIEVRPFLQRAADAEVDV